MTGLYSNLCYNEVCYKDFILKIFAYLHICFREGIYSFHLIFFCECPCCQDRHWLLQVLSLGSMGHQIKKILSARL